MTDDKAGQVQSECIVEAFLRILLKQDTALLSHVRVSVRHRRDISSVLDNLIV